MALKFAVTDSAVNSIISNGKLLLN